MKLYEAPGTCALGIRIILEEIGRPYESEALDLAARQQMSPAYLAINPKGKVPALLRPDGSVLTEFQAIAFWLALSAPEARLLPADDEGRVRGLELLDFVIGTIHMRGYTLMAVPQKFLASEACRAELSAHGREVMRKGLSELEQRLAGADWMCGDYSIADAGAFYVVHWASARDMLGDMPRLQAFHCRMLERPAVRRAVP